LYSFFVWYRVDQDDRDTDLAIRGMMARLACRSGISGRLLKKRDEPGLWMEIYADVADSVRFEHLLRQAVDEFDVEMFIDGARTIECFMAGEQIVATCA
jgi:hypothetical protein